MIAGRAEFAGHFAAIVSSSDDAIISKDLNGVVLSWNEAAERLFGYASTEAIGRHISLIIPADRLKEEDYVIGQIRAGVGVAHYQTIRQRKDGSLIEISLSVSPIRDEQGTVIGASKIARDITEQKRLQRMAEEASRAKDEFLAALSHELRTPLNTVLGYVQMLQNGALEPEQHARALEVIDRNARALGKLVDDVLDTSRIITGRMRIELRPCALGQIVSEGVATIAPAAKTKGVLIHTSVPDDLEVQADPDRLVQVLWNLLANAMKFTPSGGSVSVSATSTTQSVRISVADTGVGIAAGELPFVFQRFWQGEPGARSHSGLGLGLALVKHIIELHGGSVSVTSAGPGLGSRFDLELPRMK
jgi:PAS domain S-box-containing protein